MHPKIKELNDKRIEFCITIYRVSKETNISIPTLQNIFKGLHEPKISFYFTIKEYLDKYELVKKMDEYLTKLKEDYEYTRTNN